MSVVTRLRNSDLVKCNEILHSEKTFWEPALKRVVTGRSREYWGWPVWTSRKPGEIRRRRGKEHRIKAWDKRSSGSNEHQEFEKRHAHWNILLPEGSI